MWRVLWSDIICYFLSYCLISVDGHEADSALQLHSDQLHNHSLQPAMTVLSDVCNEHEMANCSSRT